MLKRRLIPVLLLKNGFLVRSHKFSRHQSIGNPVVQAERYNDWCVDELIYVDITRDDRYDLRRSDQKISEVTDIIQILKMVSRRCFMPLTFGGRIRTLDDMERRFENGADKITVNSLCFDDSRIVEHAAKRFGSQAIVASVDVRSNGHSGYEVFSHHGQRPTGWTPTKWVRYAEGLGVGEIFLNSIDRDGTGEGYDLELIHQVVKATSLPVVACGGVGDYQDFVDGVNKGGASAVAAANIFNFRELSDRNARRQLLEAGVDVRVP
jgi:cyclase